MAIEILIMLAVACTIGTAISKSMKRGSPQADPPARLAQTADSQRIVRNSNRALKLYGTFFAVASAIFVFEWLDLYNRDASTTMAVGALLKESPGSPNPLSYDDMKSAAQAQVRGVLIDAVLTAASAITCFLIGGFMRRSRSGALCAGLLIALYLLAGPLFFARPHVYFISTIYGLFLVIRILGGLFLTVVVISMWIRARESDAFDRKSAATITLGL